MGRDEGWGVVDALCPVTLTPIFSLSSCLPLSYKPQHNPFLSHLRPLSSMSCDGGFFFHLFSSCWHHLPWLQLFTLFLKTTARPLPCLSLPTYVSSLNLILLPLSLSHSSASSLPPLPFTFLCYLPVFLCPPPLRMIYQIDLSLSIVSLSYRFPFIFSYSLNSILIITSIPLITHIYPFPSPCSLSLPLLLPVLLISSRLFDMYPPFRNSSSLPTHFLIIFLRFLVCPS